MNPFGTVDSLAVRLTALPPWLFPFLLAAGFGAALWYYRDPVPPVSRGMRGLLIGLRTGAFALLLLALAEPVLGVVRTVTRSFRVMVLLDTSSSMNQPDDPARKRDALAAMNAVRARLGGRGVYLIFGDRVRPLGGGEPAFDGPATDLAAALRKGAAERDAAACVVIGDGRWNRGEDPSAMALPEDLPVYTILAGSPVAAPDVVLRSVSAPPVGHDGRKAPVEVTVAARGSASGTIPVEILEKGRPAVSGRITLQAGATGRVVLDLPLKGPGAHTYTVRVAPPFADRAENNSRPLDIRVLKSAFRVLILAPGPSPDLAFVRRIVEADSAFTVQAVLGAGDGFPKDLSGVDAVIVLDGGGPSLTSDRARLITQRVSGGMGLWVLGSTPPPAGSALESVLPVTFERTTATVSGSLTATLTESGRSHFLTAGGPDRDGWGVLPPLPAAAPVRPSPSGAVLAETAPAPQRKEPAPLIVAGTSGRGKALVMPVSGIWRWRLMMEGAGKGGAFFDTFVRGAVRWLAAETELAPLNVATDAKSYLGGQEVQFEGRVFDSVYRPVSGAEVSLVLDGDTARKVILEETRPGVYTGSAQSAAPGEHSWAASAFVESRRHGDASGKYTVEPFTLELLDTTPDPGALGALAAKSGGIAVTAAGVDSVLGRLAPRTATERSERAHHLALHPFLPGMVIFLLAAEWLLRKRRGMI